MGNTKLKMPSAAEKKINIKKDVKKTTDKTTEPIMDKSHRKLSNRKHSSKTFLQMDGHTIGNFNLSII